MLKPGMCFSALLDGGQFRHIQSSAPIVLGVSSGLQIHDSVLWEDKNQPAT